MRGKPCQGAGLARSLAAFCLAAGTLAALAIPAPTHCQEAQITVDAGHVINRVTPWVYGSCIEDVNHEIYGGLYDQKIFGESFEEPPAAANFEGWTAYGGAWRADGQACRVAADPGGKLVRDRPDFADGTVEADIEVPGTNGENAGLLVRVREPAVGADSFVGYEISLSASSQRIILGKHRQDWQPLKSVPAQIEPGRWHHLRVVLEGPRIRIFEGGGRVPAIDFTDRDAPIPTGRIALRTWKADAAFQNVRVKTGQTVIQNLFRALPAYSVSGQWDAVRTGSAAADFLRDDSRPFNGTYCQRIQRGPGTGRVGVAQRGLNRWGIAIKRGQTFAGRIYLRAQGLQGPVTVALQSADGKRTYAAHTLRHITNDWAKYPFSLTSNALDKNARFAVWIDRPGTVWADQAVLMGGGAERFHGLPVRADIADVLIRGGVTFLRYGGTMVNAPGYRWKDMVGVPDRRPPYEGHWYPYSTSGFGIVDFLNFCEAGRIEPAFAINAEETPQDAADLVDYVSGPITTVWGKKRAADGHPNPYRVHYIEIGNEEVLGGDDPAAYAHYSDRFTQLARAMHGRNPGLALVCAAWWRPDSRNVEKVFEAINGECACWDLHVWADDARSGAAVDRQLTQMQRRFEEWVPGTAMHAVIFEENGSLHNMQRALGHASVLNAVQRHGDFVLVDCPANCLQPWRQNDNGWDQGQIFFTPGHVWAMPPYYAQQMASRNHLPLRVQSTAQGEGDLDVTATRSQNGKTLALSVVNPGSAPCRAALSLAGFAGCRASARGWTLTGDPQAVNPPAGPETIRPREAVIGTAGTQFDYTFPANSYTVLRLTR